MHNITFVIFTYNEENRIERVIRNFKDYGNILIADNKSTDRTIEIARNYNCKIFTREKHYVFVENQELVEALYSQVNTDWIYWGFADEMLDKETLIKIQSLISDNKYDIINIDRKNYYYGKFCYNLYHARTNKIFKKHAIDFSNNRIHGMGTPAVREENIYNLNDKYFVHHFISNNASSYLNTINKYTDSEIESNDPSQKSLLYFLFLISRAIIKEYFFNKGYKAGYAGLALTQLMLNYSFIKQMKLYENEKALNTSSIEESNNAYRNTLLNKF